MTSPLSVCVGSKSVWSFPQASVALLSFWIKAPLPPPHNRHEFSKCRGYPYREGAYGQIEPHTRSSLSFLSAHRLENQPLRGGVGSRLLSPPPIIAAAGFQGRGCAALTVPLIALLLVGHGRERGLEGHSPPLYPFVQQGSG